MSKLVEALPSSLMARVADFIDTDRGANALRLTLAMIGMTILLLSPANRASALHAVSAGLALLIPLAFIGAAFRPAVILYFVLLRIGFLVFRSLDWALFALPRRVLRERLNVGAVRAFAIALAVELSAFAGAAAFGAPYFRAEPPVRFGPTVTRHVRNGGHAPWLPAGSPRRAPCDPTRQIGLMTPGSVERFRGHLSAFREGSRQDLDKKSRRISGSCFQRSGKEPK